MINRDGTAELICKSGFGARALPCQVKSGHEGLGPDLQKYLHVLGPQPKRCIETLVDLGLSDAEIGRYHRVPHDIVQALRHIWNIDAA